MLGFLHVGRRVPRPARPMGVSPPAMSGWASCAPQGAPKRPACKTRPPDAGRTVVCATLRPGTCSAFVTLTPEAPGGGGLELADEPCVRAGPESQHPPPRGHAPGPGPAGGSRQLGALLTS